MEEIGRILKMLEEGKITAEEAEKLISAIEDKRSKSKNMSSIGRMIGDTVSSALSMIPEILDNIISYPHEKIEETIEWNKENPLEITLSGGDLDVKIGEEEKVIVVGEGKYNLSENKLILSAGDFSLTLPKLAELRLIINAGDLDGEIYVDKLSVILNTGDANISVSSLDLNAIVNMGNMTITLKETPKNAILNCNMGNIDLILPENFNGTIYPKVSLGSYSIQKEPYKFKDKKYIFESGEESQIEIYCKMGNFSVR